EYFKRQEADGKPAWLAYVEKLRTLYRRRRDVMLQALEEHFGDSGRWTHPQGGLFIWATLDERIDTTDLLALARTAERVAFVPGSAAYMDGRSGASSMRLNFAGNSEEHIREGIRRIGSAVQTQVGLISTLTGSRARAGAAPTGADAAPTPSGAGERGAGGAGAELADVVELPRRARGSARRRRDG